MELLLMLSHIKLVTRLRDSGSEVSLLCATLSFCSDLYMQMAGRGLGY